MSVTVTLDTKGLDALLAHWDDGVGKILDTTSSDVLHEAQDIAPKKTGYMANSGQVEPAEDAYSRYIHFLANYSLYVHEGTRFMIGRPYLRQSIEHHSDDLQKGFSAFFGSLVEK